MSANASGTLGQIKGVSVSASFWGGFLLYAGARIGGGCTRYCYVITLLKHIQNISSFFLALQIRCSVHSVCHTRHKTDRFLVCLGCSGHGLSGMGLLSILSFIMIAATFASGISSAFLLHWYKLL